MCSWDIKYLGIHSSAMQKFNVVWLIKYFALCFGSATQVWNCWDTNKFSDLEFNSTGLWFWGQTFIYVISIWWNSKPTRTCILYQMKWKWLKGTRIVDSFLIVPCKLSASMTQNPNQRNWSKKKPARIWWEKNRLLEVGAKLDSEFIMSSGKTLYHHL